MADTYRPTKAMEEEGQRALDWIAEGKAGDGFTDVGRKRASDLAAGRRLSADVVLRMYSFLRRHEVDKSSEGFNPGDAGYPNPARVAWAAWGGDPGLEFSTRIREQLMSAARASSVTFEETDQMMQTRALDGENGYGTANYLQAADAAIDAAQTLLEQVKTGNPIMEQAYSLLVAADVSLDPVMEALGLSDPDEDVTEGEMTEEVASEVRAPQASLGVGTFVSWPSSGGRARGKVEKVVTSGPAQSSDGFEIEATADQPAYVIRVYDAKGNGFVPSDTTVVHRADILTVTKALMQPRDADVDLEQRKSVLASAERFTVDTEVRAAGDNGALIVEGYVARFNVEADGLSFREQIAPGAFTRTLQSGDPVYLLVNHDTDQLPLASTASGTLQLRQDEVGLFMRAELDPANPRAVEAYSAVSRGDVTKQSFAFTVAPDGQTREAGLRTLTDVNLFECSIVTWPAYSVSDVSARGADEMELDLRRRWLAARQAQLHM